MTDAKEAAEKAAEATSDFIEVVEEYMSPTTMIALLLVGAIVGATIVVLWAYTNVQQDQKANLHIVSPEEN